MFFITVLIFRIEFGHFNNILPGSQLIGQLFSFCSFVDNISLWTNACYSSLDFVHVTCSACDSYYLATGSWNCSAGRASSEHTEADSSIEVARIQLLELDDNILVDDCSIQMRTRH